MKVKFWGVRGTISTPDKEYSFYGGNTICLEIITDNDCRLIVDCGFGFVKWGHEEVRRRRNKDCRVDHYNVLLTHTHWDHIQGMPFCPPLHIGKATINIFAPKTSRELYDIIDLQFQAHYSPFAGLKSVGGAQLNFSALTGESFEIEEFKITPFPTNHPGGNYGYLIEADNRKLALVFDHEGTCDPQNQVIIDIIQGADVLIQDCFFNDDDYYLFKDWGHSSLSQALNIARLSKIPRMYLFHYNPNYTDLKIDIMMDRAQKICEQNPEFSNLLVHPAIEDLDILI